MRIRDEGSAKEWELRNGSVGGLVAFYVARWPEAKDSGVVEYTSFKRKRIEEWHIETSRSALGVVTTQNLDTGITMWA